MNFMMVSNIFIFIPVVISAMKGEWIYFAGSFGLSIASPIYHYLKIYKPKSKIYNLVKFADWAVALFCYSYMYYFIFVKVESSFQATLAILLTLSIALFLYGYKYGNYEKWHPWFHVFGSLVSGTIVFMGA